MGLVQRKRSVERRLRHHPQTLVVTVVGQLGVALVVYLLRPVTPTRAAQGFPTVTFDLAGPPPLARLLQPSCLLAAFSPLFAC